MSITKGNGLIQFLRSNILNSKEDAINALKSIDLNGYTKHGDGTIVLARYQLPSGTEPNTNPIKSVIGVYSQTGDTSTKSMTIYDSDSSEFAELEQKIIAEENARKEAIGTVDDASSKPTVYGAIKKEQERASGIETSLRAELGTSGDTQSGGDTAFGRINALETAVGEGGSVQNKIDTAIQALDVNAISGDGKYIFSVSEADGKVSATTKTLVNANDKILTLGDNGITATVALQKYTPKKEETLPVNVKERYQLVGKDGTVLGTNIDIPKDQSLVTAQLGHSGATWSTETQSITDGPKEGQDVLILAYRDEDGAVQLIQIALGDFLRESEFKDGLSVSNGIVKVLKDPASDEFLSVSEAGVKVSGVQAAINKGDSLGQALKVTGVNVGNLTNGTTLEEGQSIESILREMLMKEIDVTAVEPTVSISHTGTKAGTYEVGTEITLNLAHTYKDGKFTGATSDYNYTLAAGCQENTTTYYRDSTSLTSNTDTYTLEEDTVNYKCTTAYGASQAQPVTNIGNQSNKNISSGTATSGTISFTGKRYGYYGGQAETGQLEINSANIKALEKKSFDKFTKITLDAGKKQVVIAFPSAWGEIKKVTDDNATNAVITTAYIKQPNVTVQGANSEAGVEYKVYIMTSGVVLKEISHTIIIGQ